MKSQQSTNAFVKETFMDLKTQLETVAKNHQASIQNLETKFDRLADKQSGRPSGSLPSNTQPNPRGSNSKAYQPPQARNEHVNVVFTRRAGMPNYGKFLKELISNKHNIEQIPAAFLSDESLAMIQNKVPSKLGDPGSFLILCNFNKTFSCNALADLGASINHHSNTLLEKLRICSSKLTRENNPSFHQKETLLEEEIFSEFDEFMAINVDENSKFESDTEEPPFEKITINIDYKIKISLKEPPMDLELKPLPDNLKYVFLEEPSFLPVIVSSKYLSQKQNANCICS
ncbi:hypothetical protein Tco_0190780 [Tanacetum coccineum]